MIDKLFELHEIYKQHKEDRFVTEFSWHGRLQTIVWCNCGAFVKREEVNGTQTSHLKNISERLINNPKYLYAIRRGIKSADAKTQFDKFVANMKISFQKEKQNNP